MPLRKKVDRLLQRFEKEFATHNRIEISASALLANVDLFRVLSAKDIVPVLKGNAYGHGVRQVATALKDQRFTYIAVDGYFEAQRIREVSSQPVLIMGAIRPENFAKLDYDHFTFVVQDETTVEALAETGRKIKVHLECNTGMNRYGAKGNEIKKLTQLILTHENLILEGVMSHLADSDGTDPNTVNTAISQFDTCVEVIRQQGANPTILHVAQTAGSLRANSKYANTIRLGIGLYGMNPFNDQHPLAAHISGLRPALKFISTITKIIELKKGEQVSYNYTFTAPQDMKIGVLPVGYYEGIPRALGNGGLVKVHNAFTPIVGRVCMNHTMIGLENINAQVGDEVTVYSHQPGDPNTVDETARHHELFNYNLLTALSPDVRRILVD